MPKGKNILFITAACLFLILSFQNCSNPNIALRQDHIKAFSSTDFCTTPSNSIKSNLKFIFVIDRSNSNQQDYKFIEGELTAMPYGGTDEDGHRRFSAIESFIQNFDGGDDEYIYWSMVRFNTTSSIVRNFTNDRDNFYNFILNQHTASPSLDTGYTNYISALDQAIDLIRTDVQIAKEAPEKISSSYVIFFVSDGAPVIGVSGDNVPIKQTNPDIELAVERFYDLQEEQGEYIEGIQLNTAYYYEETSDVDAINTLQLMSNTGRGSFLEFSNGENIDFSKFAIPIRISRFGLKEFWVMNASTVWEGDQLRSDSDSDGLSDYLEKQLGSDPFVYDTDGNGAGDGVEYRVSGNSSPCNNLDCSPSPTPYASCNSVVNNTPTGFYFNDTDNDYLNDCEEILLSSDYDNPDTNGDYIPDHIAFLYNVNIIGKANVHLDPDADGIGDYDEIKQNTPTRIHNDQIKGAREMQVYTELVSEEVDRDCYRIVVDDISYVKQDDKIRMYILENTKALTEKRVMRTAEKPMNDGAINFQDSDFK